MEHGVMKVVHCDSQVKSRGALTCDLGSWARAPQLELTSWLLQRELPHSC